MAIIPGGKDRLDTSTWFYRPSLKDRDVFKEYGFDPNKPYKEVTEHNTMSIVPKSRQVLVQENPETGQIAVIPKSTFDAAMKVRQSQQNIQQQIPTVKVPDNNQKQTSSYASSTNLTTSSNKEPGSFLGVQKENQTMQDVNNIINKKQLASEIFGVLMDRLQNYIIPNVQRAMLSSKYQPTPFFGQTFAFKGDPTNFLKLQSDIQNTWTQQAALPYLTELQGLQSLYNYYSKEMDTMKGLEELRKDWWKEMKPSFHNASEFGTIMYHPEKGVLPVVNPAYTDPNYLAYQTAVNTSKSASKQDAKNIGDKDWLDSYDKFRKDLIDAGYAPHEVPSLTEYKIMSQYKKKTGLVKRTKQGSDEVEYGYIYEDDNGTSYFVPERRPLDKINDITNKNKK